MKPIFLILYIVIVTLVLTLALPRLRKVNKGLPRVLWIASTLGGLALLIIVVFLLT
jgi:hypothetical protein